MATTALFVEIVVVGLETAAWLLLLVLTVARPVSLDVDGLARWSTQLGALALGIAYVLGVIVDRLADSLYDHFGRTWLGRRANAWFGENCRHLRTPANVAVMQLTIMKESVELAHFLAYQRSRWRIARGTVVNLAAAIPVVVAFLCLPAAGVPPSPFATIVAVTAVGLAVLVVSVAAAERIHSAYLKRLCDAYRLVRSSPWP